MKNVFWMPVKNSEFSSFKLFKENNDDSFLEPISYIKYFKQTRDNSNAPYLNCPAFSSFYKNTFVILSPLSFSMKPNKQGRFTIECGEEEFEVIESYYLNRTVYNSPDQISGNYFIVSLPPLYCFTASTSTLLEILPLSFNPYLSIICGSYDISKWVRPMDFTVEFLNPYERVKFNKGDPLMCVRFVDAEEDTVSLKKNEDEVKTYQLIKDCLNNRNKAKDKSLKSYYQIGSKFITS